jgi:serine kinase of HPr protein (carbohydrate metabolism regulator)
MNQRLSSEMVHATTVAKDGRGVVIAGRSGSGKSDLALRLIDRGFELVSDDQTIIVKAGDGLVASAPATIRGKIEVRGIGILDMPNRDSVVVCLWVTLSTDIKRLPDGEKHQILGIYVPEISLDALTASAPIKVDLALERLA